tara:strand:- start:175 stop:585 length:411 start_codon:yes stop_codon:yes gene_type:complete
MNNEKLDDIFEIETELVEIEEESTLPVETVSRTEDVNTDYQYTRTNYYDLIEKGTRALESSLEIAQEGQHPRAYEVTAQLLKNVGDLNKDLMELQLKVEELKGASRPKSVTTNNTMFVGSTKELQQMLKRQRSEDE